MYVHLYPSNAVCLAGKLKKIDWLCVPRHQSSQAHPRKGSCTLLIPARWTSFPSKYRTAHPVLPGLPTKLAEWNSENLPVELELPEPARMREAETRWRPTFDSELGLIFKLSTSLWGACSKDSSLTRRCTGRIITQAGIMMASASLSIWNLTHLDRISKKVSPLD